MFKELNKYLPKDIVNIILSYHYRSLFNNVLDNINTIKHIRGVKRYTKGKFEGWTWGYYDKRLCSTKYIIKHINIGTFNNKLKSN
jgi:hypothetical protein